MFQKNPLLMQLKEQLYSQKQRAEGVVKATKKSFGFLKVDTQKTYFISPLQMKKVMHGDRISAVIHVEKGRTFAEPETLVEPFLTRFVGKVHKKDDLLYIYPDHLFLKEAIHCRAIRNIDHDFQEGDWAVAEMRYHPLKDFRNFYAELTQFITYRDDHFFPWWVTLARYNLEKEPPNDTDIEIFDEQHLERRDLTALDFITIDSISTEDIDDALYVEENTNGKLCLTVAISDPTAWIAEGSKLDKSAKIRAFTNYLPSFTIPMLPRVLSDDLCSLRPHKVRLAIACRMTISLDGSIENNIEFFAVTIKSKAKLVYEEVSDWLENTGNWQPENHAIATQIRLLHRLFLRRCNWRTRYAIISKEQPEYRFVLGKNGEVLNIISSSRRIANRIIEELMIAANVCAARTLRDKLGFGVYNVHTGFDPSNIVMLVNLLKAHDIQIDPEELLTLSGFCKLRRKLNAKSSGFFDDQISRFQSFAEISKTPGPHFALGLEEYATWTSPIRKYGDMVNHRLLKSIMKGKMISISPPEEETIAQITERRRLYRIAKREVRDWLYARFLNNKIGTNFRFTAEIIAINSGGIRIRLIDNGAIAYIPVKFLNTNNTLRRNEGIYTQENNDFLQIKGEIIYKITDLIDVTIAEVHMETRSIIARPSVI